jgi:Transmembrane protein 131-like N-terminal/Abnormal spindle-like microcephaly-assoc'd, ASPM-SPD-2-Hydin
LLAPALIAILLAPALHAQTAHMAGETTSSNPRGRLVFTPAKLRFGRVHIGRREFQQITVTNYGTSKVTLLQVTGEQKDFKLIGLDFPVTLARGESLTFTGVFAPRSKGDRSGIVGFVSDAPNVSSQVPMTGMGADDDQFSVVPATMNFGTVQVGSSGNLAGTLIAGDTQVTIGSATSSSPEFILSGLPLPLTIPPGGSQGFWVTFVPQSSGSASATLTFVGASGEDPVVVESLNGVGIVSQNHSVDLSWNASNSQNVIGYNIYRGTQSGGPYSKINSALDASTLYTDTNVSNGATYYYVTTAVNSSDEESAYSNQAQAVIP